MSWTNNVHLHDGDGNAIGSFLGAINTHDADVHRSIINTQFDQHQATTTTISVAITAGDTSFTVASAVGFAVGNFIHIENAAGTIAESPHPKITAIAGNVITIDRPIDNAYAINDIVTLTVINMNVVGTLAAPQSFKVYPLNGYVWHLTRILIEMTHTSAGDNGLFGNLAALTNGVVLRRYDGTTGLYNTFTIWRTNSDIVTDMYDVTYSARSGGGGAYGTNCRGTFANAGAIVYLDGAAGDHLDILVQDDLSALTSFRIKAQGHYEGA